MAWIEHALASPDWRQPDPAKPGVMHAFLCSGAQLSRTTGGLQSERPSTARDHRLFRPPAERQTMKMHYDEQVDALYLSLDESDVVESEEVKPGIILDFNAAGEVVGIEVLDVKRRVPSADLKQLELEVASASGS